MYFVQTPQGNSREMSLADAEEEYQRFVSSLWVKDCDKQKISIYKTTLVKQHVINGTEIPLSFY